MFVRWKNLASEAVESATLTFQRVDHVHGCDGLALGVLTVGDRVSDDVLQEDLQNPSGLLVDESCEFNALFFILMFLSKISFSLYKTMILVCYAHIGPIY